MKTEDILQEIQKESDEKKYHINQRYTKELNRIKLKLELDKASTEKKITQDIEQDIIHTQTQMISRARLSQKLKIMEKRKEIIDSFINKGTKRHLNSKNYDRFLEETFNKNYKKGITVTIKKGDKKAEEFLRKKKIKPGFSDILGGFIFAKEKIHINKSFDIRLENRIEKIEREIADMLEV